MSQDAPQDTPAESSNPQPPTWSRTRRWLPLVLITAEATALFGLQYAENSEWIPPAEAYLGKFSVVGLGTILLFLWFVFLAPATPTLRRSVGVVGLLLVLVAVATVKVEGVTGDVHFRFNWRWAPKADETLPDAATAVAEDAKVDLVETTPDDSPQFLGANRSAAFPDVTLAQDWDEQPPKLLWRQPIGAAWSSFAIVGPYGVTQEQRGEEELISCYDLRDGKLQWAHATPVRFEELIAGIGPRATPTIHEGKVYAMGALGDVDCLDGATGKPLWHHNVVTETGATPPQWGKSCSPLIHENLAIVSAGGPGGKSLVAYDKNDGRLVWSAGDDASSYASPVLMTLCGQPQIVMINQSVTCGHDPADGRILWQHPWPEEGRESPNVAQPVAVGDDRILFSKGYGVGSTVWQVKHDGDEWSIEPIWRSNNLKTKMTNAVVRDGYAYGLDENTLSCIDLATGNKKWKRGRFGHGQVLLVGEMLLVQSEDGQLALVAASPDKFQELTHMTAVDGQSWNYPALAGNRLVVRSDKEVACYELPVASP